MLQELRKNESVEEGGKYVGYIVRPGDDLHDILQLPSHSTALAISDFLPSGPNANRSAVELMPDGAFQEALFRELEARDQQIEHLGSWHSHHCNGLRTLSSGDIEGYFKTVNKQAYNVDVFLASLVTAIPRSLHSTGWLDHYLFVRGEKNYYSVTDRVRLVSWPTPFGDLIRHESDTRVPAPATDIERRAAFSNVGLEQLWFETEFGRSVLATDKRFFDSAFATTTATRRDSQITLMGRTQLLNVCVTYPREANSNKLVVVVKEGEEEILRIESTVSRRRNAYRAALTALQNDQSVG